MKPTSLAALALLAVAAPAALQAQSLYEQARAAFARNQLDTAYNLIQRAAEAEPNRAEVHAWLGQIAGRKAQRGGFPGGFGAARKCKAGYSRAVALEPGNLDYLEGLAEFLSQAPGIVGGDRDSALVLAERIRRSDEARGTFLMADVLRRGNARWKARADSVLDAYAGAHAADRTAQLSVANSFARNQQDARALPFFERLAARDTSDALARYGLGRTLVVLKREPRRAQPHLWFASRAPAPAAGQPSIAAGAPWWRLGQSYVQLGIPDSARICFERALQLNPQLRQARQSLDSLSRR
jgi:tetratricopeptide (TPR) repeat protein